MNTFKVLLSLTKKALLLYSNTTLLKGDLPVMNKFLLSLVTVSLLSVSALPAMAKHYTPAQCPVVGNASTHVYYTRASANYGNLLIQNYGVDYRQCFPTVAAAERAGFSKTVAGAVVDRTEQQVGKALSTTKRVIKEDAKKVGASTKKLVKKAAVGTEKAARKVETKMDDTTKKAKTKKKSTTTAKKTAE
jgi:hypothetical protein